MISHECEKVVAPGTVVFMVGRTKTADSVWGVTLPYEYWEKKSHRKVVATFQEYSRLSPRNPQIPTMEFDGAFKWQLGFRDASSVKPLCPLEEFRDAVQMDDLNSVKGTLWACSFRDGSRYYKELLPWLTILAEGVSRESFVEDSRNEPAYQLIAGCCSAIRKWKKEHIAAIA